MILFDDKTSRFDSSGKPQLVEYSPGLNLGKYQLFEAACVCR
jgi:hypothetical protein